MYNPNQIVEDSFDYKKWKLHSDVMLKMAETRVLKKMRDFCKQMSEQERVSVYYVLSGMLSGANHKNRKDMDTIMEKTKCCPSPGFLNYPVYAEVINNKISHDNPIFNTGVVLRISRGTQDRSYTMQGLVKHLGINVDNYKVVGNYCTVLHCAYAHAANTFYKSKTAHFTKGREGPMPDALRFLLAKKDYLPWLASSTSNNLVPPLARVCHMVYLLHDNPKINPKDFERPCGLLGTWVYSFVSDKSNGMKSPEDLMKSVENMAAFYNEIPAWNLPSIWPPDLYDKDDGLFVQNVQNFSAGDIWYTYLALSFMGILNHDLGAVLSVAPDFIRQTTVMSKMYSEDGKKNHIIGSDLVGVMKLDREGRAEVPFGQRAGGGKGKAPVNNEENRQSILAGYRTRGVDNRNQLQKQNAQPEILWVGVDRQGKEFDLKWKPSFKYVGTITIEENRARKKTAQAVKDKAIKRSEERKRKRQGLNDAKNTGLFAKKFRLTNGHDARVTKMMEGLIAAIRNGTSESFMKEYRNDKTKLAAILTTDPLLTADERKELKARCGDYWKMINMKMTGEAMETDAPASGNSTSSSNSYSGTSSSSTTSSSSSSSSGSSTDTDMDLPDYKEDDDDFTDYSHLIDDFDKMSPELKDKKDAYGQPVGRLLNHQLYLGAGKGYQKIKLPDPGMATMIADENATYSEKEAWLLIAATWNKRHLWPPLTEEELKLVINKAGTRDVNSTEYSKCYVMATFVIMALALNAGHIGVASMLADDAQALPAAERVKGLVPYMTKINEGLNKMQ